MAPYFYDCQGISIRRFIDIFLSRSINSMCTSEDYAHMVSEVEPFVEHTPPRSRSDKGILDVSDEITSPTARKRYKHGCLYSQSLPANSKPLSSFRNRKPPGLSISTGVLKTANLTNPKDYPAPTYCDRNVEMRHKSLGERQFFRPISESDDSDFTFG